ncbi:MAM domain-containing glycosylphosphatidylinositol anchor protein 2-like protein [Willisornis vidua]|uniref:MAM domain-containing glycosylphosphatidylinositol anchor protein 2-like protein n=1 Tax=Willisornis vidua TaxID=1566151 RepID=A0ABQ9DMN2_9PASS|nr:MAM domain-containing glycosylphosphatidylinositol anchor protein 2-like protein [Willisornis vidua]
MRTEPPGEFHCGFEDGNICLFTQDDTDNFDWTKQSTATRDTKYTPNTGPNADRTGSKEGSLNVYLRLKGQTAMENPLWSSSGNKGQHWNQARVNINPPTSFQVTPWARLGVPGLGVAWVNINPPTSFQLIFEGIRGPGIEGDIAIDDVSIVEGECLKSDQPANIIRGDLILAEATKDSPGTGMKKESL